MRVRSKNAQVKALTVNVIEGKSTRGTFFVKPLIRGDRMTLLEVRVRPGVAASPHAHAHESVLYVVKGKLKTMVGNRSYILETGDAVRHPSGVVHTVEALEETIFVEAKSPAPDLKRVWGTAKARPGRTRAHAPK